MALPNFSTGSKTSIGTSAVAISSIGTNAKRGIQIVADPNNTVIVYVGTSSVTAGSSAATTDGYPLQPGDTVVLPVIHPSEVYAITASSTATIHFMLI